MNLCGDKLEDDCEIASEENNSKNKEESEDGANKLNSKPNMNSIAWSCRRM